MITKSITLKFNIILFLYLCVSFFMDLFFEPENSAPSQWDHFYELFPAIAIALTIALLFVLLAFGAWLVMHFWNNFISDTFKIREITYHEALSTILMATIFTK